MFYKLNQLLGLLPKFHVPVTASSYNKISPKSIKCVSLLWLLASPFISYFVTAT